MDVYEAIRTRKSVRSYLDREIKDDVLSRILGAGRLAPSARNDQEWRLVVVRDRDTKLQLSEAANNQEFVAQAGAVIACCGVSDGRLMRCGQDPVPIDVAIIIDHITLAAVAEGLGTCWVGSFYPDKVRVILGIPEDIVVVELLAMGYPRDPSPVEKNRLPLEEIVRYESW